MMPCSSSELVPKCKSMCLMHSEAKQCKTSGFRVDKDLLQGPARGWEGSCFNNPKTPISFQQSPFLGKEGGSVVSCCRHLLSVALFLRSGNDAPVNSRVNVILCSD